MKADYQISDHGAGRFSVQVFDAESRKLVEDRNIVRDVNGWRIAGMVPEMPQFSTPRAAGVHFATLVAESL